MSHPKAASRRRRIVAFLLDHILFSAIAAFSAFAAMGPRWDAASEDAVSFSIKVSGGAAIAIVAYFFKDVPFGHSPGKWALDLAVRDATNPSVVPSAWRLVKRNLAVVIWPIEAVALATSDTRQRLGDRWANTTVIRREAPARRRLVVGGVAAALFLGAILLGLSVLTRSSAAYEAATAYVQHDAKVANRVGTVVGFGSFPSGSIQVVNGHGAAMLSFRVIGTNGDVEADVALRKTPGNPWSVESLALAK